MPTSAVAVHRLAQQRLAQEPLENPEEVVTWLGAVQAQDYAGAKWSLGLRMQQATDDAIDRAFNAGTILRTHALRPTWHFVTPADIRWILDLTAPRVNAANAYRYRQLELGDSLFPRANAVIAKALAGGQHLTRPELGAALEAAGIKTEGQRLAYLVMRAELDGVVCSGPRRGKQFTYALMDERAPPGAALKRDEALAELTRRYYTGHGPATVHDFVWWSGLTVADARAGLALLDSVLTHAGIDGETYWFSRSQSPVAQPLDAAFLLPTYDEFLVGYAAFDAARRGGRDSGIQPVFTSPLVIGGSVRGSWRRTFERGAVIVEVAPFDSLTPAERESVVEAARRYGEFVGRPVTTKLRVATDSVAPDSD